MSRPVAVPDFGAGDSLWQYVTVAEPGEPGYPTPELPLDDPWAPAVNQAIREVQASADRRHDAVSAATALGGWRQAQPPEAGIGDDGLEAG
jgi:hypothetical protein